MNDFWEWMRKKKYGGKVFVGDTEITLLYCPYYRIKPTNQMLIGYMMEYLREVEGKIILNTGGRATIETVYDCYVKDVEKIERESLLKRMVKEKE